MEIRYPAQKLGFLKKAWFLMPKLRFPFEAISLQSSSRWMFLFRRFPVTSAVIAAAVVVQVAVWVYPFVRPNDERETSRHLGAVTTLAIYEQKAADQPREQIPQLLGPFDLWEGELWRVPISGFHHANIGHPANPLHLVMNCLAIAFMGSILEPRMGRWWYAAFFLSSITVSAIPELLMSEYGVGLSGGAYALFGCLLVLMQREEAIADRLPPSFVSTGFIWLFLCMVATFFDVIAIGNAAHVTGLIYGWFVGQVFYVPRRLGGLCKTTLLAGHLLLIPAGYFLMHPFWLGSYHWYQAKYATEADRKVYHLEQSIDREPSLRIPWSMLAQHYADTGESQRGWETILRGLDYNRSDDGGVKTAQKIWKKFRTPDERWKALQSLQSQFGKNTRNWQFRLGILSTTRPQRIVTADGCWKALHLRIGVDTRGLQSQLGLLSIRRLDLPTPPIALDFGFSTRDAYIPRNEAERDFVLQLFPRPMEEYDLTAPQIDPFRFDSAAEGVSL
ncbi:MAG: rhomboid family intramembrane serine protease [Planctomycetaceae bacterium]|nr:rhomboid family intramembrane serine protease [Planctomycetaceae bacterium]